MAVEAGQVSGAAMQRLSLACLRRPLSTVAAIATLTLALGLGLPRVETDVGYRAFLGETHPAILALDRFAGRFGGGLPFAVVWSCRESSGCERALDPASLAMAHALTRALEDVAGVRRVDGPATTPLLFRPTIGLPEARRLAPEGRPARDLEALATQALADPTWRHHLVSPDGRAGALVVHLEDSRSETGVLAVRTVVDALPSLAARGFVLHPVGGPVEFVVAGDELARGTARLVPAMVGLVALILIVLFRSVALAAAALIPSGLAVVWTQGLQGWLGWSANSLSEMLPPLVLVIGVCDAVHLLSAPPGPRAFAVDAPAARCDALGRAAGRVGGACALTTATTAAGLASFSASGLESIARFGLLGAFGTAAALLICFALLPLLLARMPARWLVSEPGDRVFDRLTEVAARSVGRAAPAWLLAAGLLSAVALAGVARLEVDARFEDLYGAESRVVRWARAAALHLRAAETLEIEVALPSGVAVADPEALRVLEQVEALAALPGLAHPLSLRVALDRLHRALHGGPLVLDDDPERAAERGRRMLRLLTREEPELVGLFADREAPALRVSFVAEKLPQRALRALLGEVRTRLGRALPEGYGFTLTGPLATVATMIDELRATQLASFGIAALLVFVLTTVAFRSLSLGALAMLPTLLPVVWTLGVMGALGVALDVGSAMVAAVVLGLAVDDAVHFLAAWRRLRRAGVARDAAAQEALREVGRALVTTSLALALGFTALALAPWQSIASFGGVAAIAIGAALAASLLVLPSLLTVAGPGRPDDDGRDRPVRSP